MEPDRRSFAELLTPPGAAALAVVRIAGPLVGDFLARHLSQPAQVGKPVHGDLRRESGEVIDDAVVWLVDTPPYAEICLHGGPWVVQATLSLLQDAGFEVVGCFDHRSRTASCTQRDCDEPDSDVAGIEHRVVSALPLATTALAMRTLLSQVEAWCSFARAHGVDPLLVFDQAVREQPVLTSQRSALDAELARIRNDRSLHHLLHPPTVAIVGPANAGKSTLANALLGRERSIVADLPGTTRDWVGETANLDGLAVVLIDTPGIRTSDDSIEQSAIAAAVEKVSTADLVLLVLDRTQPLQPEQQFLIDRYPRAMIVLNKCDRPAAFNLHEADVVPVSAQRGDGLPGLIAAIKGRFGVNDLKLSLPRVF